MLRELAGGVAGAAITFGVAQGIDAYPTQRAIDRAHQALVDQPACERGELPFFVEVQDERYAQRFICSTGVVVMTLQGPDWSETREHNESIANQGTFPSEELFQKFIAGMLGAFIGVAVGNGTKKQTEGEGKTEEEIKV
jgi:hypothetical protein